jgi:inorganic triphosphatase YgiF
MDGEERELKLRPASDEIMDRLEAVESLGPFRVLRRWRELQRNAYFDTPTQALKAAGVSLRRRSIAGQPSAVWTVKGPGQTSLGVTSRPEIEVVLGDGLAPALAVGVLEQAARERGAPLLAARLSDALARSAPPTSQPYLEIETDRRLADLEAEDRGWRAEMALDRVGLAGHPEYHEQEIEVELKRGDVAALAAARAAIASLGTVEESPGSKLSRAAAHLAACPAAP